MRCIRRNIGQCITQDGLCLDALLDATSFQKGDNLLNNTVDTDPRLPGINLSSEQQEFAHDLASVKGCRLDACNVAQRLGRRAGNLF